MTVYGSIINVATTNIGEAISGGIANGDSVMYVTNVNTFPAEGGQVYLPETDAVYAYSSVDTAGSCLNLTNAFSATLDDGSAVEIYPFQPQKVAYVSMGDEAEAINVVVPYNMQDTVNDGFRDEAYRETVVLEERETGDFYIYDIYTTDALTTSDAVLPVVAAAVADAVADLPPQPTSDGLVPSQAPSPVVGGLPTALFVSWTGINNADPVSYDTYISTDPTFTADSTTFVGTAGSNATNIQIASLHDGTALVQGTTYYVRVQSKDEDGLGPISEPTAGMLAQITPGTLSAEAIAAIQFTADQITGGTINSNVTVAGKLATGTGGARAEITNAGIVLYDSTGTPTTVLGTNSQSTFNGNVVAQSMTSLDNFNMRGINNEVGKQANLTLASSITGPGTPPSVVQTVPAGIIFYQSNNSGYSAGVRSAFYDIPNNQWIVGQRDSNTSAWNVNIHDLTGAFVSQATSPVTFSSPPMNVVKSGSNYYTILTNGDVYIHSANPSPIFTDTFSSGSYVSTSNWTSFSGSGNGTAAIISGVARVQGSGSTSYNPAYLIYNPGGSSSNYTNSDIVGKYFSAKVNLVSGSTSASYIWSFILQISDGTLNGYAGYAGMRVVGSDLRFTYTNPSGTLTETAITYSASTHAYWKISEQGGNFVYQTSVDGVAWTTQYTKAHGLGSSINVRPRIATGNLATGITQDIGVDNFTYSANPAASPTTGWTNASRTNTAQTPVLGSDGSTLFVAEASGNKAIIRTLNTSTLAVTATYTSTSTISAFAGPFAGVLRQGSTFTVKGQATGDYWTPVTISGSALTFSANDQWPSATASSSQAIIYDGSNFIDLVAGRTYTHSNFTWVGNAIRNHYVGFTWYDSNGTTHETILSPTSVSSALVGLKKRQFIQFTAPDLPVGTGSTDDVNSIRLYISGTTNANSAMWLQGQSFAGSNTITKSDALLTSGTNPPTVNNFPADTPGQIRNSDSSMIIKGDGTIVVPNLTVTQGATIPFTPTGPITSTNVQSAIVEAYNDATAPTPFASYYRGTSDASIASGAWTTIPLNTVWTPPVGGITYTSNQFNIVTTGRYSIIASIRWNAAAAGSRGVAIAVNGTIVVRTSIGVDTTNATINVSKIMQLTAGDTVQLQGFQNTGSNLAARYLENGTYMDISWVSA